MLQNSKMGRAMATAGSCALILVIVLLQLLNSAQLGVARTVAGDVEALKAIKDSVDANSIKAGSCLGSWNFSVDPCDYAFGELFTCGLRCDGERVTEVTLDDSGYNGTLPPAIAQLSALQILDLTNNAFHGPIPHTIGNLTDLVRLLVSHNSFSGNIPASLSSLSNLQQLSLDDNSLEGPIPATFNNLTSLVRLELNGNNLSDRFPMLSALGKLNFLDVSDNQLSGPILAVVPPSLVQLSLRNNGLSGELRLNLAGMSMLQVLDLSHNKLSGPLPSGLFDHPALEQLTLSYNRFTSLQVPGSYGTDSQLIAVDLSYNRIHGPLPVFMATMPSLSALSLQYNYFTGIIPLQYAKRVSASLAGKEPLVRLFLAGNFLFGEIPTPFMNLSTQEVNVSFGDNCLLDCPKSLFFCQGGDQKAASTCRAFTRLRF
uniref:Disease resistance R13L4/SHOC-2-like LRR domain-containing protein n=1 Tax=Picea sitchensis TaxID=3332 RepID=A9NV54_PICSI|nr:unknown [Picea sitchensis]